MKAFGIIFSNIHDRNIPELVRQRTLASIPFGGRYRLIDFPLSNMVNSGIDTIGVITKKNYQSLMDHVGSGKDWDLARKDGGLIILPPFGDKESSSLYSSRLEALKGISSFIERADEEYVVMTDCDNVTRLNFNDVIEYHIKSKAEITLVYRKKYFKCDKEYNQTVIDVSEDGRINGIKHKSVISGDENIFTNIYVMKRSRLMNLIADSIARDEHFTTDYLARNASSMRIFGYEHKGFFAPINSLQSYYDRNMDLLDENIRHELFGDRSVYTKIRDSAPTKYGTNSVVKNSMIADGCVIEGDVENSIIFRNVKVERGAVIKNSIVMQNTIVGENANLNCVIIDKNVSIMERKNLSGSENFPFYIPKGTMI